MVTDTTVQRGTLTRADINAMRKCDQLVFHHTDGMSDAFGNGLGTIRAITRAIRDGQRYTPEYEYEINVQSLIRSYDNGAYNYAFAMVNNYGSTITPVMTTILASLRADDIVTLEWIAGNNSPMLDTARVHNDELVLCVKRGNKHLAWYVTNTLTSFDTPYIRSVRMVSDRDSVWRSTR